MGTEGPACCSEKVQGLRLAPIPCPVPARGEAAETVTGGRISRCDAALNGCYVNPQRPSEPPVLIAAWFAEFAILTFRRRLKTFLVLPGESARYLEEVCDRQQSTGFRENRHPSLPISHSYSGGCVMSRGLATFDALDARRYGSAPLRLSTAVVLGKPT